VYQNRDNTAGLLNCNNIFVLFDNGTVAGAISWAVARYDSGLALTLPVFSLLAASYVSWQNIFSFLADLFHILTLDIHLSS
jgi:hypothetical protein